MRSVIRKPSIKKSVSSRTTARITRTVRKLSDPTYGKKGIGYIKDPGKAIYNKVYNKTSYDVRNAMRGNISHGSRSYSSYDSSMNYQASSETYIVTNKNIADYAHNHPYVIASIRKQSITRVLLAIFLLVLAFPCFLSYSPYLFAIGFILIGCSIYQFYKGRQYRIAYKNAKECLRKLSSDKTDEFLKKLRS